MGLYFIQVSYKAFVYAVKLKCEVGILNRLVDFVKSASAGSGAANGPGPGLHDDDQCDHHRRFENFHSFQLSSQVEREWEMTLRNTFGVGLVDEEEKGGAVATTTDQQQKQQQQGDPSGASLAIATPLPPSPDPALVVGEKRARPSGGSSSSSRKRRETISETRRKRSKYRQMPELRLLDTFGGSQRSRSRNSIGSMDGSPGSDGAPHPDRRSSFGSSSGAETAAVIISEAGSRLSLSSSPLRRPGGDPPMEGLQGSGLSLGSVRDI